MKCEICKSSLPDWQEDRNILCEYCLDYAKDEILKANKELEVSEDDFFRILKQIVADT